MEIQHYSHDSGPLRFQAGTGHAFGGYMDEKPYNNSLVLYLANMPNDPQVDFWGHDVNYDWDWWFKQVDHYVPQFLY